MRTLAPVLVLIAGLAVASCSQPAPGSKSGPASAPVEPEVAPAAEAPMAFGVPEAELAGARLVMQDGTAIGRVDRVVRHKEAGFILGVLATLTGERPRQVMLTVTDVTAAKSGRRVDVTTRRGPAAVAALPTFDPADCADCDAAPATAR